MSKVKYIAEGGSSNRPPLFDGSNYYFWKGKMELFLRSQDNDMWQVITDGDFVPTTKEGVVKEKSSWSTDEKAQVLLNSKARLFLSCALTMDESERVDECKNAKEVWDTLKIHHEGTSHVKETRIDIGVRKFEVFEMSENETIDEMYARFTTIVNEMRSLGKAYSTHDRIRKILRCLPSVWRPMVTAITQANDLKSMNLEDLIGSLRAHEVVLQGDKPVKKVKTLALKASQQTPSVADDEVQEPQELDEVHEEEAEDELALISKRIQRMMLRRNQIRKKFPNTNNSTRTEADKSQVTCYGCNKTGHYKSECPDIKKVQRKPPFKKKAMITWDDLEESEPQEDEEANMGLMAQSDDEEEMEGCMTEVVKTLVEKLLNKGIEKSRYLLCFTCIVKEFNEEKKKLQAKSETMKQRFKVATEKGKDIESNAKFWEEQADGLIQENTETNQRCFLGFCPDCIWRYKSGEALATKIKEMKNLREEKFENVEVPRCLPGVERYSSKDYISFESRELKCKELLEALKDDRNYMVGLHGMGGSGKTTLAKEVGKQLKRLKHFNYVMDTTVSSNPDINKIQNDIAGSLGLEWEKENESDRPKRLWSRLTNGDKILVILDDVWENLNFDDIGLPNSDNHNGCKVLVTTRNLGVLKKMACGKTIQLDLLTEEEAWIMFKEHADLSNISSTSIIDKGRKIAIECKGLPVAIATIASSLKGLNSREEWDVALNSLKNPVSMGNVDDHLVDIFKCLKFSYDHLKDEKAKGLFLLCSAFPEDEEISVEFLTRLGIGVNLFGEGYKKYNVARTQVSAAKNKLLRSCLLLQTEKGDVKMHDLVREVAQWIAKEEILVENLFEKNQKSLVEKSKNIKNLYFHGKLSELFSSKSHWSDGSKLKILIAKECDEFQDVPTPFLENMAGLRVLIFSNSNSTRHSSLANSIKLMINIRSLSVEKVILGDISVLGRLQSLETLELHYCEIEEFSPEIAELKKLRLLCLKECEIKSNNPFEVIQNCPSLEELYFLKSFNKFCQEITLPRLERLERYVLSDFYRYWDASQLKVVALREDYFSKATYKDLIQTSYCLHLFRIEGYRNLMPEMVPIDGMNDLIELHLEGSSQLQCLVDSKQFQEPIVFSKLAVLELERMEALKELCNGPISSDSMNNLKKLYIKECENLQSLFKCSLNLSNLKTVTLISCSRLVSVFKLSTSQSLPLLEELKIVDCEKLENIIKFERRAMDDTIEESGNGYNDNKSCYSLFPNLKVLHIERCPQLQFILPILSARDLLLLEDITIRCCHKLKYIFGQHQDVKLTSLKTVVIDDLPNFIDIFPLNVSSISKDGSKPQTQLDPIKSNTFSMCCYKYKLKSTKIPLVSEETPQQGSISLESNSHCLNISEPAQCLSRQSHFLCNSKEIQLSNFSKIKSVFIPSIAPRMLETLIIEKCDELKQIIIDTADHNSTSGNNFGNVFPKLKRIGIQNCVQLEYIFGHYNHDHQNHTEIHPPFDKRSMDGTIIKELRGNEENGQQMDLSLESIKLFGLPMMTCLFVGLKYSFVLDNLTRMEIIRCEKLEIVFSTSVLRCLPQLVNLRVEECSELKHIIEDDLEDKIYQSSNTFFPKLETLVVEECDKLKYVFPVSICKEFPELKAMFIRQANDLEEIFKSDKKDEIEEISKSEVQIPNLKAVAFVKLPSLCHAQGVHFQTVKYRLVHSCQKLSLTTETSETFKSDIINCHSIDYVLRCRFRAIRAKHFHSKFTKHKAATAVKHLRIYLEKDKTITSSTHSDVAGSSSGQLVTSEYKTSSQLEGSTSEITAAATVSTTTETKNKPSAQEVVLKQKGIQINFEEGNTSANAKTITSSTHLDVAGSSSGQLVTSECKTSSQEDGDSQITMTSFSICTAQTNDQGSLNHDSFKKGSSNTEEQFPKDDKKTGFYEELPSGPTSEITAAATVSTITHEVVPKQKINVEGNTSAHLDAVGSSSGQLVTSEYKTSSQEDVDSQIAMTSFSVSTSESNDQGSLNHDSFKKVSSSIEEQFPKDDDITVSKSIPSPSIKSPVVYQFPPVPCKEDPSQKVEDLSSLLVKSELEQLVIKNHLDWGNFYLLNDFFVKHPYVRLKDTSLSNRYKGCAYNLLAELLKFLKTHSVLEVLGSFQSEFVELLQDARRFGFDKDWLDGVERRTLCPDMQVSQDVLKKLLDSKEHVTKEVEVLRLKIGILSEQMEVLSAQVEVLKHELISSEAVLESINQQEVALSAPIGY